MSILTDAEMPGDEGNQKDTLTMPALEDDPRPGPPAVDVLGPDVTVSGEIEADREAQIMMFVRAQSAFIRAQIYFLEVGRNQTDDKSYIEHLTGFATAQAQFVKAQQDFLHTFGVV